MRRWGSTSCRRPGPAAPSGPRPPPPSSRCSSPPAVEKITFEINGYADKRETATYNEQLAADRVAAVESHLEDLLDDRKVKNELLTTVMGEIERPQHGETDEELKPFRRVDIVLRDVLYKPQKMRRQCGEDMLCQRDKPDPGPREICEQPTTKWQAQITNVMSEAPQIFGLKVGPSYTNATVEFRMQEADSVGRRCKHRYYYWGVGAAMSLEKRLGKKLDPGEVFEEIGDEAGTAAKKQTKSTGTQGYGEGDDWTSFETEEPMFADEFEGKAGYSNIGASFGWGGGYEYLWLPAVSPAYSPTKQIKFKSTGIGWGAGISSDLYGRIFTPFGTQRID